MKILTLAILLATISGCAVKYWTAAESEQEVRTAVTKFCDGEPRFKFPIVAGQAYVEVNCTDSNGTHHRVGYMLLPSGQPWVLSPGWHFTN